ncbi:uncharacterized protein [Asterias amurensis]|uniref:uncharacterized protein n=1 Tax=Asterias amurensis TaxID=7602 RepID=UPI003AB2995F
MDNGTNIMQEKLAKWKSERAEKTSRSVKVQHSQSQINGSSKEPLKERHSQSVAQIIGPRREKTFVTPSFNRHQDSSNEGSTLTPGRSKAIKDARLDSGSSRQEPAKRKTPEMSMREKLELWRLKKQQSASAKKVTKSSSVLQFAVKRDASSSKKTHITPSAKTMQPSRHSNCTNLALSSSKSSFPTPKKHLFKTPTSSLKSRVYRRDTLGSKSHDGKPVQGLGCGFENDGTSTPSSMANRKRHATCESIATTEGSESKKRKAVSFIRTTPPSRCSPRLQKPGSNKTDGEPQDDGLSTPKQPWQDRSVDMRHRLESWLAAKGKTPSRYSHVLNFKKTPADVRRRKIANQRAAKSSKRGTPSLWQLDTEPSESNQDEVTTALNATMEECILLLQSDCPTEYVSEWLNSLVDKVPTIHRCAKYWLCRITIAQQEEQNANEIINIYERAVEEEAQPIQDVKDSLQQYVIKLLNPIVPTHHQDQSGASPEQPLLSTDEVVTPEARPVRSEQLLQSSVLKYCLTESTPLFDRIRKAIGEHLPATTPRLKLVTPVRRSIRLDQRRSVIPSSLLDHDVCLASLDELQESGHQEFILRPNRALEAEFLDEENV